MAGSLIVNGECFYLDWIFIAFGVSIKGCDVRGFLGLNGFSVKRI